MRRGLESVRPVLTTWLYAGLVALAGACAGARIGTVPPEKAPESTPPAYAAPTSSAPSPPAQAETVPDEIPLAERVHFQALKLDATGALHAFCNRDARWSPDRRSVVFLSDREGQLGAYLSDWRNLSLPPRPVKGPRAPILDARFHPGGRALFLLAGGFADSALYIADIGRGTWAPWGPQSVRWQSAPRRPSLARGPLVLLADAPPRVFFGTVDDPDRDTVALDPGQHVVGLSPGGERVLLVERGRDGERVAELDRKGSHRTWVEPADGRAITAAAYAPDGKSVLFASRSGTDPAQLLRVGKSEKAARPVFAAADASTDVVSLAASARSPNVAVLTRSPEGMAVLLVEPGGYRKPRRVVLPQGIGELGSFSRDGKVLTLTWETPSSPPDVYEVATDTGRVRKLRADVRPALARLEDMTFRRATVVSSSATLEFGVFEPAEKGTKRPAALLLGQPGPGAPSWRPEIRFLVGRGLVVLEAWTPCGTNPAAPGPTDVRDWLHALDTWLPSQAWWAEGSKAVIAREAASRQLLDAIRDGAPAWATVLEPGTEPPAVTAPLPEGWSVLLNASTTREAWARSLRKQGARVEYAVHEEPSARLAREMLFLERMFGR